MARAWQRWMAFGLGSALAVTLLGFGPSAQQIQAVPMVDAPADPLSRALPADDPDPAPGSGQLSSIGTCTVAPYAGCAEADLRNEDLRGVNLTGANLARAALDGADASAATLSLANLVEASLVGTVLDSADLERANVTHADLSRASLRGANAEAMDASRATLAGADLSGASLRDANLQGADLRGAILTGADLAGADLTGARWTDGRQCQTGSIGRCIPGEPVDPVECVIGPQAQCPGVNLTGRSLRKANLTSANLIGARLDGVDAREAVLSYADLVMASLVGTNLDGATMLQTDLTSGAMSEASARNLDAQGLDASWADLAGTDFRGSDLTGAFLGAVRATGADFSGATLTGANLSAANLTRANLAGADLSNAVLRNADLQGAKLAKATLVGADLSGATWVDGRTCAEGSLGSCAAGSVDELQTQALPGNPLAVMSVIGFAVTITRLVADCGSNVPVTGSCFDTGAREQFKAIRTGVDQLQAQMKANQEELRNALNLIIQKQDEAAVRELFRAVQSDLYFASLAVQKYSELVDCIDALDKGRPACTLTNTDGARPEQFQLTSPDDLYAGTDIPPAGVGPGWKPSEDLATGGPVARLLFATLYRFGGGESYTVTKLIDRGRNMQMVMAGTSDQPKFGLLPATVDYLNSVLATKQGATSGSSPAFIPGTYMVEMNRLANYYVQGQASFYGPAIAALMLVARNPSAKPRAVADMQDLAENGGKNNPQWALPVQQKSYTFALDRYGVDPTIATDPAVHSDRPERVGVVIGTDGKVYRVQTVYGATARADAYPNFPFPTYASLEGIQRGIGRTGVTIGTLQRVYPYTFPGGSPAAWWAGYGTSYKVVEVGDPRRTNTTKPDYVYDRYTYFLIPDQAPQAFKWGNNVVWARHSTPCVVPVRMWNSRPSFQDASKADGWSGQPATQLMVARNSDAGYKRMDRNFVITFDAVAAFNDVVTTGAAPAYNLNRYDVRITAQRGREGTGVLWRCGGYTNDLAGTTPAPANFVSVRTVEPEGLLTKLVAAATAR